MSTTSLGMSSVVTCSADAVGGDDDKTSGSPVIVEAVAAVTSGGMDTALSDSVPLCSISSSSSSSSSLSSSVSSSSSSSSSEPSSLSCSPAGGSATTGDSAIAFYYCTQKVVEKMSAH